MAVSQGSRSKHGCRCRRRPRQVHAEGWRQGVGLHSSFTIMLSGGSPKVPFAPVELNASDNLDGVFTSCKPPTHSVCEVQRRCEHIQTTGRQQCVMADKATAATTMMIRDLTCTNWNDPCWHVTCLWLDRELAVSWRNCMTVCARLWFL